MATNDVPGANPANNDTLHEGCWAEHEDGSLILVQGMQPEDNRVIFSVFDLAKGLEYRTAMPENNFKSRFSWKPSDPKSAKWTWHDKTAFPWDRIMQSFPPGERPPFAEHTISQAERVKRDLRRRGIEVKESKLADVGSVAYERTTSVIAIIGDKITRAFNELRK